MYRWNAAKDSIYGKLLMKIYFFLFDFACDILPLR